MSRHIALNSSNAFICRAFFRLASVVLFLLAQRGYLNVAKRMTDARSRIHHSRVFQCSLRPMCLDPWLLFLKVLLTPPSWSADHGR